jgi:serine/threonine protein kinase
MSDPITRLNAALEGRYRIERELGEGGMATVYLADDLRHERRVALKVLKPELAAVVGAERFLAEIKTTANLQHPHILPLHDSGEADGFLYHVMPYIEGETLRDRLERERQLPVDEAVRIATDVAEALQSAHEQGVIHRDVKPANILLSKGRPLVADFGIALAVSAAGAGRLTETGLSVGTPYYMSPEQASADREPSPASDVYSLGCVLYEMLVGEPPYTGMSAQAVLTKILTEMAPSAATSRASIPANVDGAIRKALEKLPADRFTSAQAFAGALNDPGFRYGETPGASSAVPVWRRALWPVMTAMMAGVAILAWMGRSAEPRPVMRLRLLEGESSTNTISASPGPRISPDGSRIAFIHLGNDGRPALAVRRLDSFESRDVASSNVINWLSFSPDGQSLAYHDGAAIRTIAVTEGAGGSQVLAESVDLTNPRPITWEPDGWIYYNDTAENLVRIRPTGGEGERLATVGDDGVILRSPKVIPDQDAALVNISAGRYGGTEYYGVLDFATGMVDTLGTGAGARIIGGDILVWVDAGTLFGQRFDLAARERIGTAMALADGIPSNTYSALFDVSGDGTLVYQLMEPGEDNIVAVSRAGVRVNRNVSTGTTLGMRLNPQGTRAVLEESDGEDSDIWVLDLPTGARTRITFGAAAFYPVWNLDGSRVAYYRIVNGEYDLYWKNADGSGVEEPLLEAPGREIEVAFVPGSDRIVVRQGDRTRAEGSDIWLYDIGDPDSGRPIATSPGNEVSPMVSPDGRYVAYTSDELRGWQVFVRSLDNPAERQQVSIDGGSEPYWSPDGNELFFRSGSQLMAVPISLENGFSQTGQPLPLFSTAGLIENAHHTTYALMPDRQTFLFIQNPQFGDTRIVVNWMREVRQRLSRSP